MEANAISAAPSITLLALSALVPSDTHIQKMRRSHFDSKQIDELSESIKTVGVLQPILVRLSQANGREDRYEIVAGERRWLGAKKAGIPKIPATIRTLSDDQVLEVQLIENLQRKDLHPLEEAQGYEELMKLKKIGAEVLADTIGRSRSYIDKRVKLLALCPEARKAFFDGELDASRALLIARIGHHDTQREALGPVLKGRWPSDGPMSYTQALNFITSHFMLRLKDAPFDLNDEQLLPKAGSCQKCPKRTGNQKEMFSDVKGSDLCTDPKCFDDKRQAIYFVAVKDLQAKGKKVLYGDAAKKVFPHWKDGSSSMARDYLEMNATTYTQAGRSAKVSALLGPDYEPILVQHPANGKILELARQQDLDKATRDPKKTAKRLAASRPSKPQGPDVDEMLLHRLVKMIGDNAPKSLGKSYLLGAIERTVSHLNTRDGELAAISAYYKWPATWRRSGMRTGLPKQVAKMDERSLMVLLWQILFTVTRYQGQDRKTLLSTFNIDEGKTRELIIAERKAKAKAEREARAKRK